LRIGKCINKIEQMGGHLVYKSGIIFDNFIIISTMEFKQSDDLECRPRQNSIDDTAPY
jgi:hypothetical protein